jgi:hypothetical protein
MQHSEHASHLQRHTRFEKSRAKRFVGLFALTIFNWRLGAESNRCTRLCRPLHHHSAT